MLLGLVKEVELHRYRGQGYRKTGPVIVHCRYVSIETGPVIVYCRYVSIKTGPVIGHCRYRMFLPKTHTFFTKI